MAMDGTRQHVFVILALFMIMKCVIVVSLAVQQIGVYKQNVQMLLMVFFILEGGRMNTPRSL